MLHLDSDRDILTLVAQALDKDAFITSATTVESGLHALETGGFDLAIVDLELDGNSGADLLPHLNDAEGLPIPVIVYSSQGANPQHAERVKAALAKSRGSIDDLVGSLRKRLGARSKESIGDGESA